MKKDISILLQEFEIFFSIVDMMEGFSHFEMQIEINLQTSDGISINRFKVWFDFENWDNFSNCIQKSKHAVLNSTDETFKLVVDDSNIKVCLNQSFLDSQWNLKFKSKSNDSYRIVKNEFEQFPKWW